MSQNRSFIGLIGLGIRRVYGRLTGPTPGRTLVCLCGVATAIGVLVIVSGISLGLAGTGTVEGDDVDYWIVPDDSDVGSTPFAYEGARLSGVHSMANELNEDERISYATPVGIQPLQVTNPHTEETAHLLALGIIPTEGESIADIDTGVLDESYPYYADGGYDGEWTGELIASPAAAEQLNVTRNEPLEVGDSDRPFQTVAVADENPQLGISEVPVVVVHLAELQTVTTMAEQDYGDQVLVATDDSAVRDDLEGRFEGTTVETRSGLSGLEPEPTDLPFALAVAAGIAAFGLGVIFITTMMGLELTATRQQLAVFDAVGVRYSSIALVLVTETVTIAVLGGLIGVGLGMFGILLLNTGLASVLDLPAVATLEPLLVGYALLTAILIGLFSIFYPLYIARRTKTLEELSA